MGAGFPASIRYGYTSMPRVPALCKACGAVSPSPLRTTRPDADVAFEVPCTCRACGASARVPAEVLQRLTTAVAAAEGAGLDEGDLERLLQLLPGVERSGGEEEPLARVDLVSRVADGAPRLLPVARALPSGTKTELAAFLRIVAAALPVPGPGEPADVARALERALEAEFERAGAESEADEAPDEELARARRRLNAASRNDPCPCGSGEKYKACHWLEDRRRIRG